MKNFLLVLYLSFLSFFSAQSQNLGQINENNILKIEYFQYDNGKHVFKIINKVPCVTQIKVERYNNQFTDHVLSASSYLLVEVTGTQTSLATIKAKKTVGSECHPNPDDGWVEMASPIVLPITFQTRFGYCFNADKTIDLQFSVQETADVKKYYIKYSSDGKNFRYIQTVTPNKMAGLQTYKTNLK